MPNVPVSYAAELNRSVTYLKRRFPCLQSSFIYQISPSRLTVTLFSEFSQTQTPPLFREEKEQPPSIVIGYNTRTHDLIKLPKRYISEALIRFYLITQLHAADFKGWSELSHFNLLQTAFLKTSLFPFSFILVLMIIKLIIIRNYFC